ncbi:MAG: response regulator transcription factor [Polyangia bacterium]|jgi:two-component system phosphate regulon response regulator PhoB
MVEASRRPLPRILVVEDEIDISTSLSYSLKATGYEVQVAERGEAALQLLATFCPDLVLLDVMLPDISGFDVCRRIRATTGGVQPAVIMLTAKSQELNRVAGFEVGADDYVTKPFSIRELVLRIDARLKARRPAAEPVAAAQGQQAEQERVKVGPLEIDRAEHRVFVSGEEIRVSALEMRLLLFLVKTPGKMRTRKELLTEVWGYHPEVSSRTLDTHVKRIRDKFGAAGDIIQTVRGVGYRLAVRTEAATHKEGKTTPGRKG